MSRRLVLLVACFLVPLPSWASFHRMAMNEIMTSYGGSANVQFVEMRMLSGGQTVVNGSVLAVFDSTGAYIADVLTIPGNLLNGGADVRFLMATPSFAAQLGAPTPDFTFPDASLPTAGGMVCWGKPAPAMFADPNQYVDCFSYGTYTGPTNEHVCSFAWSDADGHSLARVADGTHQRVVTACEANASPQNNNGASLIMPATTACGSPPATQHNLALAPLKPIQITIPSSGTKQKKIKLKVTNATTECGGEPVDAIFYPVVSTCPLGTITASPDFDPSTPAIETTRTLLPGKSAKAQVVLNFNGFDWTPLNKKGPSRCQVSYTVTSTSVGNADPDTSNETITFEVNVKDKNDPDQATTMESLIGSVKPVKVTLGDGVLTKQKKVKVKLGNADILPVPANPGHVVTANAYTSNCPVGMFTVPDYDAVTAGDQNFATVKGGKLVSGTLLLNVNAGDFLTLGSKSPSRCVASFITPAFDADPTNDVIIFMVDVNDKNDY